MFGVRGVVAQDMWGGSGANVLITGVVQTPLSPVPTPFAHSIGLVPTRATSMTSPMRRSCSLVGHGEREKQSRNSTGKENGGVVPYSFQIHNDALSLLTGGDSVGGNGMMEEAVPQQQQQTPSTSSTIMDPIETFPNCQSLQHGNDLNSSDGAGDISASSRSGILRATEASNMISSPLPSNPFASSPSFNSNHRQPPGLFG